MIAMFKWRIWIDRTLAVDGLGCSAVAPGSLPFGFDNLQCSSLSGGLPYIVLH